jgi:hemophore-related protein
MSFLTSRRRTLARGGLLAGALATATVFVGLPMALADPPPNCTAADLEGVRAGVSASTSAYLFTHPEYNAFVTSLSGLPRAEVLKRTRSYLDQHPDVKADITGIRQPLIDIKYRCAAPPPP